MATIEIGDLEFQARRLIDSVPTDGDNWDPNIIIAQQVWRAMWASALTVERVHQIGCALCAMSDWGAQEALDALVRRKVLRTHRRQGKKLYEIRLS